MKTPKDEFEEIIDLVVKLAWNYTIFRELFKKNDADYETRIAHPEFFMTMHDSLLCAFSASTTVLFEESKKATSFWSLIRKSKPELTQELEGKIQLHQRNIKKIKALRHQVFAHRWQAKSPREVFAEVNLPVEKMGEIADLAKSLLYRLAEEIAPGRKEELQKQQLNSSTLEAIAVDVAKLMEVYTKSARVSLQS